MPEATLQNPTLRLSKIQEEVKQACKIARREVDSVALIAVSKTRSTDEIRTLLDAGHRLFGENRVQEAASKWPELRVAFPDVELHLIGQLQSNKAEEAVALFDCIHSLDRKSLLTALSKAMAKAERQVPCYIQVNIGEEEQKGGCAIAELPELLAAAKAQAIEVIGLMCIPPADVEPAPYFALLAELAARHGLSQLSMGMSDDFPTAIQLGATHIRVGTALFGPRPAG